MITLDNISKDAVVKFDDYDIISLASDTGAQSVKDIINLMHEYPDYDWTRVLKYLNIVRVNLDLANLKGNEPDIFPTNGYSDSRLLKQDTMNCGGVLLLDSPIGFKYKHVSLKDIPISEIKTNLSHTTISGKNMVGICYKKIGPTDVPKIARAVKMYEEQIERQAKLTDDRDSNLFTLDRILKIQIIDDIYNEIVAYLVSNTIDTLIWSELSEVQKKIYISSTINYGKSEELIREQITNYVANYTTVPELEGISKKDYKVLKRFIVR